MHLVGRKAVREALRSDALSVTRISIASSARGADIDDLVAAATGAQVPVDRVNEKKVDRLAGDNRQHQGVVAAVDVPPAPSLSGFLDSRAGRDWATNLLLLDHVHNPANVGMILRTAAAAGIDGVILPRQGTAGLGPLVIKAGSGMVFAVPHLDVASVDEALIELADAHFSIVGLDADGENLFSADLSERSVFVLGNESVGLSATAAAAVDRRVAMPLFNGVESLNVAAAAAVVSYELVRRRAAS